MKKLAEKYDYIMRGNSYTYDRENPNRDESISKLTENMAKNGLESYRQELSKLRDELKADEDNFEDIYHFRAEIDKFFVLCEEAEGLYDSEVYADIRESATFMLECIKKAREYSNNIVDTLSSSTEIEAKNDFFKVMDDVWECKITDVDSIMEALGVCTKESQEIEESEEQDEFDDDDYETEDYEQTLENIMNKANMAPYQFAIITTQHGQIPLYRGEKLLDSVQVSIKDKAIIKDEAGKFFTTAKNLIDGTEINEISEQIAGEAMNSTDLLAAFECLITKPYSQN